MRSCIGTTVGHKILAAGRLNSTNEASAADEGPEPLPVPSQVSGPRRSAVSRKTRPMKILAKAPSPGHVSPPANGSQSPPAARARYVPVRRARRHVTWSWTVREKIKP